MHGGCIGPAGCAGLPGCARPPSAGRQARRRAKAHGGDGAVPMSLRRPPVPPVPAASSAAAGQHGSRLLSRQALTNLGAQGGALAAVSMASLLVARTGGPDRGRRVCAHPRAALAVRSHLLLRPADRLGLLPGRRLRQGPAGTTDAHADGRGRRGPRLAGLAGLRGPVPSRVFPADAGLARVRHDRARRHPAVDGHGQGLLSGRRGHHRREPGHRRRRTLVRPGLPGGAADRWLQGDHLGHHRPDRLGITCHADRVGPAAAARVLPGWGRPSPPWRRRSPPSAGVASSATCSG